MTKVFEGELLEDTDWISTSSTVPTWIGTFQYKAPEVGMDILNETFSIPLSKIFDKMPNKPKRIIIFIE